MRQRRALPASLLTDLHFTNTIICMERKNTSIDGKAVLITGGARRLGKAIALNVAQHTKANIILHHAHSPEDAEATAQEIRALGRQVWILEADLADPIAASNICESAFALAPVAALINNAAVFKPVDLVSTTLEDWNLHMQINLTAPFQLSQSFAKHYKSSEPGRIINMLDWRALRPGKDHFPYTISKAALAAMTKSLALSLAPEILVNAVALGAILPPENETIDNNLIKSVPMQRWAELDELGSLVTYLLTGPAYITGEIIHLDGGRHLK